MCLSMVVYESVCNVDVHVGLFNVYAHSYVLVCVICMSTIVCESV